MSEPTTDLIGALSNVANYLDNHGSFGSAAVRDAAKTICSLHDKVERLKESRDMSDNHVVAHLEQQLAAAREAGRKDVCGLLRRWEYDLMDDLEAALAALDYARARNRARAAEEPENKGTRSPEDLFGEHAHDGGVEEHRENLREEDEE